MPSSPPDETRRATEREKKRRQTGPGKGKGAGGQHVNFLLRSLQYSSQQRDARLCFRLGSIIFGVKKGSVRFFYS